MKFLNTLSLLSLAIAGSNAMRNISSKELVKELTIGWSLGNTLDATCFDTIDYNKNPIASETCWGAPKTTQALYDKLAELGFNTFRIPTTWSGHIGGAPDYKINEQWMKRVHEIVDYALNTGGYAILNVHHETWNYTFNKNLQNAKTVLAAIWKQIAAEFANYDEHLIFEGLNEPRKVGDPVEWSGDQEGYNVVNELNEHFIKTIRATGGNNALRHLMIPPYAAGVIDQSLNTFKVPRDDNKIIVSLHSYSPYNFALNNGAGAVSNFYDGSEIDWVMNTINQRFLSQNIPVIIGEFGAMSRNNEADRARWAEYYVKKATSIGVPCILWDNAYYKGTGERFGAIDRSTLQLVFPDYVNALMKGLGDKHTTKVITRTTTTTSSVPTNPNDNTCFSTRLGYGCCNSCDVVYTDNDGKWGVENGNWCGIKNSCNQQQPQNCWAQRLGYSCCQYTRDVYYTDSDGQWGVENGNWCGIN